MKKLALFSALALAFLASAPGQARAQEQPLSLGIVPPLQRVPVDQSVGAFRFSLIFGRNVNVKYVDLGLVNKTDGKNEGIQLGAVGLGNDFSGFQWNWLGAYNTGYLKGVQLSGLGNYTESGVGVQWSGIFNGSESFEGLQVSLVNYTKTLQGLQVGIINIIAEGGDIFGLPVFPFVNFDF